MRLEILLLLLLEVGWSRGQVTTPTSGQCQAICLKEYASYKEFRLLDGSVYKDIEVVNNTDFSLCKLGCHSPGFNELTLPAFKRGQAAYENVIERSEDAPLSISPLRSVSLLCADRFENSTLSGRLLLDVVNASTSSEFLVHFLEGVAMMMKTGSDTPIEKTFWQSWSYSQVVDFSAKLDFVNCSCSIQFRVTSFDFNGIRGKMATSRMYAVSQTADASEIQMVVRHQMWRNDLASTEIAFVAPVHSLPVCSLVLSYHPHAGHEQRIEFSMDRSRGYLLESLNFDRNYTVGLATSGPVVMKGSSSHETSPRKSAQLKFQVPPCITMVDDPSLCAPPPVEDIEWKWNVSETDGHTVFLTWAYGDVTEESNLSGSSDKQEVSTKRHPGVVSYPRMVHFDVSINPLVTPAQYQCQYLDSQRRIVTWTHRSTMLYILDDRCNYEVEVTVVDGKNRRSPTRKSQLIRFEEKKSMMLIAERWNIGLVLLFSSLLVAVLVVAAGMAVCRVRDRREFDTLKRTISPRQDKAQILNMFAGDEKHSRHVIGKRPISSDESEASAHTFSPLSGHENGVYPIYSRDGSATMGSRGTNNTQDLYPRPPTLEPPAKPVTPHRYTVILKTSTLRRDSDDSRYEAPDDEEGYHTLATCRREDLMDVSNYSCPPEFPIYYPIVKLLEIPQDMDLYRIPMSSLNISNALKNQPMKPWKFRQGRDTIDGGVYGVKYSKNQEVLLLRRELDVLCSVTVAHPGLVDFHGVGFCDDEITSLLFEPCRGGCLSTFLYVSRERLARKYSEQSPTSSGYHGSSSTESLDSIATVADNLASKLQKFAFNIAAGLAYLHDQKIVHTHVSVYNVYLVQEVGDDVLQVPCDQEAKLGDYAWCQSQRHCEQLQSTSFSTDSGLVPPEVLLGRKFDEKADVWQFGLLLCDIVSMGNVPSSQLYRDAPHGQINEKIVNKHFRGLTTGLRNLDPLLSPLKATIAKSLATEPNKRPSIRYLLKDLDVLPMPIRDCRMGDSVLV